MAQINEYQPETNAQGAVGGVTPNLEAVSLFGRGVEHVGAALTEAGDAVHRRQAQQEVSQVYGQFAQARADWNIKLKERLKDGSLDPDKFDQEYADYVNKAGDGIQTAEGKDFFNRQANRLGGTLMQNAIICKAKIAGEQAYSELSSGINVHVANLMAHPDQVDDAIGSTEELLSAKQKDGTLSPEQVIAARRQLLPQLAEAAVKGLAEQDPGVDANGNPLENLAKQSLDKGHFAELLNEPQRSALYQYARAADNHRETDSTRAEKTAHRVLESQGNEFMDKNANRIIMGDMSVKEVMAGAGTLQQKEYMINKIKAASMDETKTDPKKFASVYGSIVNGDITTRAQLVDEFNKGGLAPATMDHLMKEIDSTPDGHMVKNMQKNLDKMAQGLRFKGPGVGFTAAGDAQYTMFQSDIFQARQAANQQGVSDRAFFSNSDPKDPNSPIAILNKHRLDWSSRLNAGMQEMQGAAMGQQDAGAIKYANPITKEIPPPQAPGPQPQAEAPQEPVGQSNIPGPNVGGIQFPKASAPTPKSRTVFDPHPNDTPEVAANRERNRQNAESLQATLESLKTGLAGTSESQGFSKAIDDVSKQLSSLFSKPTGAAQKPSDSLRRSGESQEQYLKRRGL
jgi:hypothetical protein